MERHIRRIRRLARRWVGRRVEIELFNGRDFEGVIVSAGQSSLLLRRRIRGRRVLIRYAYRRIADIDLD